MGVGREVDQTHRSPVSSSVKRLHVLNNRFGAAAFQHMQSTHITSDSALAPAPAARVPKSWRWVIAIGAVVLLAGTLRFTQLSRVGIEGPDESWYVSDARLWHRCALLAMDSQAISAVFRGDKPAFKQRVEDIGLDFSGRYIKACQGFTFLGAAMMFVVGDHPDALLVTNALFGTLSVLVLFLLGASLYGRSVGLCAALLLAVSPYHLNYCRSAMTQATGGMILLTGMLIWVTGRKRNWTTRRTYLLSGLIMGYAAITHYTNAYVGAMLIIFDAVLAIADRRGTTDSKPLVRTLLVRWKWYLLGCVAPALIVESGFQLARLAATLTSSYYYPIYTFFEGGFRMGRRLPLVFDTSESVGLNWAMFRVHTTLFAGWHGWLITVAGAAGLLMLVRARGASKLPVVVVLATFSVLILQPLYSARGFSVAMPFVSLSAAMAIVAAVRFCSRRASASPVVVLSVLVTLVVAVPALGQTWYVYAHKRSDAELACQFLRSNGPGTVVAWKTRRLKLYLEGSGVNVEPPEPTDDPDADLQRLRDNGVDWMVVDPFPWARAAHEPWGRRWAALHAVVERDARLVAEFDNLKAFRWGYLSEGQRFERLPEMQRQDAGALRIYDLRPLPQSPAKRAETDAIIAQSDRLSQASQ